MILICRLLVVVRCEVEHVVSLVRDGPPTDQGSSTGKTLGALLLHYVCIDGHKVA